MGTFHATFSENGRFSARFSEKKRLSAKFGEIQYIYSNEWYDGDYVVTPIIGNDIILATERKLMASDLTVKEIPITQTSNLYGGKTVVIG